MTAIVLPRPRPVPARERQVGAALALVTPLLLVALARGLAFGGVERAMLRQLWLAIHLATVLPALPLAAWLLLARKGTRAHRLLGRVWAVLMMTTALASFGVRTGGGLSWIHILSAVVLVAVPRAVASAIRGDLAAHRRGILGLGIGLVAAALFTLLPGRLLGQWLVSGL